MPDDEHIIEDTLDFYKHLADHPWHGVRQVGFDAVLSTRKDLDVYYDDGRIADLDIPLTRGKTYHIHTVWACGDFAEFLFQDDRGGETRLNGRFFDEVRTEVTVGNIRTIVAVDDEDPERHALAMQFEVFREGPDFDLEAAIGLACKDFVRNTKDGWTSWVNQGEDFDWAHFWLLVPNDVCETYGFRKLMDAPSDVRVDLHGSLVGPADLCLDDGQVTELVSALIANGNLACIDFLQDWLHVPDDIPYYNYADQYKDLLEKSIRKYANDHELWSYYMEHVAPRVA